MPKLTDNHRKKFLALRKSQNVTQREAAESVGCSQTSISLFERGLLDFGEAKSAMVLEILSDEIN